MFKDTSISSCLYMFIKIFVCLFNISDIKNYIFSLLKEWLCWLTQFLHSSFYLFSYLFFFHLLLLN